MSADQIRKRYLDKLAHLKQREPNAPTPKLAEAIRAEIVMTQRRLDSLNEKTARAGKE